MGWREDPIAIAGNDQYVVLIEVCDDGSNGYKLDGAPIESFRARLAGAEEPCGIGATPRDALLALRVALQRIVDDIPDYASSMAELQIIAEKTRGGADREDVS